MNYTEIEWQRAVARLREGRLLAPSDQSSSNTLDAHPLVREWFGERLRAQQEQAWRLANDRLYEFLRKTVKDRKAATLQELTPLYQAIPHGCRAGRHQEVLEKVYRDRLSRRGPDGSDLYHTFYHLGAPSTDLAAISWFFNRPFDVPVAGLSTKNRRWLLHTSGLYLYSQGRLAEAQTALQSAFEVHEDTDLEELFDIISLLSTVAIAAGDIKRAKEFSRQSLDFAIQSRSKVRILSAWRVHIDRLIAGGEFDVARRNLVEVNQIEMQLLRERTRFGGQHTHPSDQGRFELLIINGDFVAAHRRANRVLRSSGLASLGLRALFQLQVARSSLGLALTAALKFNQGTIRPETTKHAQAARAELDEAVERLRLTERVDLVPGGYCGRSAFRRSVGDWNGAARDLDEVGEIAELGPMKLHLCDMALGRARLAFAKIEAFAPLNGMVEKDNPPKPAVPSAEQVKELKREAEKQLKIAADSIEKCGYHRRDEELAELQAVLRGVKKFADLPPRV